MPQSAKIVFIYYEGYVKGSEEKSVSFSGGSNYGENIALGGRIKTARYIYPWRLSALQV
jgi:hypothetical protein